MIKLADSLSDKIATKRRKLDALREEFDRVDANHPHRSFEVQRDIAETVQEISALQRMEESLKTHNTKTRGQYE